MDVKNKKVPQCLFIPSTIGRGFENQVELAKLRFSGEGLTLTNCHSEGIGEDFSVPSLNYIRHPELVSGSIQCGISTFNAGEMLKQVQHDNIGSCRVDFSLQNLSFRGIAEKFSRIMAIKNKKKQFKKI